MFSFQLGGGGKCKPVSVPFGNSLYPEAAVSLPIFDEVRTLNGISLIIDRIDSSRLDRCNIFQHCLLLEGRHTNTIPRTSRVHPMQLVLGDPSQSGMMQEL